ncbi:MAG: hypothetical protein JWN24_120 [Phycisphaerales bacterium]|nr:hypothetical protein [Phycisphaerales bacterium]
MRQSRQATDARLRSRPLRRRARRAFAEALETRTLLSLSGNQLFPADSPWNHPITNAPVAVNSAILVSSIGATKPLHPDFGSGLYAGGDIGIPYNVVSGNQPKVSVVIDAYASESDLQPVPIPVNAVIEGDPLPPTSNIGDRHLLVYDKDNNLVYELFHAHRPTEEADGQWHADSEAIWNMNANSFRTPGDTSADAAGLPILPGLTRADEVLTQGAINHALRFTVPASDAAYVFPASHQAGSNNPALPRMGERFRLKQNVDISGYSPADQIILQTLKTYGMIVADNGGSWFLSGAPDPGWNNDDLHALTHILGGSFEAVDLTPIVSGLGQLSGPAGSTVTVQGLNFTGVAGQLQVSFGTVAGTNVTVLSDNTLTVTVPTHAVGPVDVKVTTPYGTSVISAADKFTFITPAAPTYLGTQIDDGNRQRSEVRSLTFQFSSPVTLSAGAITLAVSNAAGSGSGANDGAPPTDASSALDFAHASTLDGGMSWVIPFIKSVRGFTDGSGSLVDNVYAATIHASLVTDVFGQSLVAGDEVKNFHRLYGDVTGDGKVSNADFTFFSNTFGLTAGQSGYNRYFDFVGSTVLLPLGSKIGNADFTQFSNRFGKQFNYIAN